jgi:pimeloyl-ACP methyl ester carboxylesterase
MPTRPPLLLIHGLSASGSTFTHASIPGNLASHMLGQGREVWVLDLRTSSANKVRGGPYTFEDTAWRS